MTTLQKFLQEEFSNPEKIAISELREKIQDKTSKLYALLRINSHFKSVTIYESNYKNYGIKTIVDIITQYPEVATQIYLEEGISIKINNGDEWAQPSFILKW